MEQSLQCRLDLCCHIRKEEDAISRKCSGIDIMRITKNIFSAQSTWVIQTVNGFGWQGASLCVVLAFQDISGQMVCMKVSFCSMERKFASKRYFHFWKTWISEILMHIFWVAIIQSEDLTYIYIYKTPILINLWCVCVWDLTCGNWYKFWTIRFRKCPIFVSTPKLCVKYCRGLWPSLPCLLVAVITHWQREPKRLFL